MRYLEGGDYGPEMGNNHTGQGTGEGTGFSDVVRDTVISPTGTSALDAVPQAYTLPPASETDRNAEEPDPYYDPGCAPPPAADYFGTQGYRVVRDRNGNLPSASYTEIAESGLPPLPRKPVARSAQQRPGRSIFGPDSSTKPRTIPVPERASHGSPIRTVVAAGGAALLAFGVATGDVHVGRRSSGVVDRIFDTAEAKLRMRQEYFDKQPLIKKGFHPVACLEGSPYESTNANTIGDMDVTIRPVRSWWGHRTQDIVIKVSPLDDNKSLPNLIFRRVSSFPYDHYEAVDAYTKEVVGRYPCEPAKPQPTGGQKKSKGVK